jgi:tetratricopeptide (TPR) repeat protein
MDDLVVFVSYAGADGHEFARALVNWLDGLEPPIVPWFAHDNPKDRPFDQRIEEAIIGSRVVLLVLTPGVADTPWVRREIHLANRWETPILAVRPHWSTATMPFPAIEMSSIGIPPSGDWSDLEHQLRLLRPADEAMAEMMAHRDEAERLISTSRGAERHALRSKAGRLSAVIQQEQRRRDDPLGAERQVRRLIADGQRADAVDDAGPAANGPPATVDGPPTAAGWALKDRYTERDLLLDHLVRDDEVRILTLFGPAGVGKTAIVAHISPQLRQLGYADIIYLTTHGPRRVTPELLLEKVAAAHPDRHTSTLLLERLANGSYNWHQNLNATMAQFSGHRVLIAIDNVEELIVDRRWADPHLREFAHSLARGPDHGLRLLLVSRTPGPDPAPYGSRAVRQVEIPPGLPRLFADELARQLDADRMVGLGSATDETLGRVHRLTAGNPGRLELIYGILRGQLVPDLDELLRSADADRADGEDSSCYLMRRVVSGLSDPLRRVLQALAVYGRPTRSAAVAWLLAPHYPGYDTTAALDLLCDQRIVRRDDDLFHIPADTHGVVLETIPLGRAYDADRPKPLFTRRELWSRAADYFRDVRGIEREIRDLGGLRPHFEEIDLRLAGREFPVAAVLINQIDYTYLRPWGYESLITSQRERLVGQLGSDTVGEVRNLYELATIYLEASRPERAEVVLQQAQELARTVQPGGDSALLLPLAKARKNTGRLTAAVVAYEDALRQCRPEAEAAVRLGLASCLIELGRTRDAVQECSLALEVALAPRDEAQARLCMGLIHLDLGTPLSALALIEEARRLADGAAQPRLVASCDDAAAYVLIDMGQLGRSRRLAESAIKSAMDTGNVDLARETYYTLALGQLLAGNVPEARDAADAAARFFDNQRPLAALALHGITELRLGRDRSAAERSFRRAESETERLLDIEPLAVQVLDIRGLVLTGLALCDPTDGWEPARHAYRTARDRSPAPGVVVRAARLLDELLDGDSSRDAVETRLAARGVDRRRKDVARPLHP